MSEEIKEILDRLDFNEWEVDLYKVPITWCELYDIRDYITSLQQKVEQLENIILTFEKWLKEHSVVDYSCKDTTIHEQLALSIAYDYFESLLEDIKLNKGSESDD